VTVTISVSGAAIASMAASGPVAMLVKAPRTLTVEGASPSDSVTE
jgi:hypothetical protein